KRGDRGHLLTTYRRRIDQELAADPVAVRIQDLRLDRIVAGVAVLLALILPCDDDVTVAEFRHHGGALVFGRRCIDLDLGAERAVIVADLVAVLVENLQLDGGIVRIGTKIRRSFPGHHEAAVSKPGDIGDVIGKIHSLGVDEQFRADLVAAGVEPLRLDRTGSRAVVVQSTVVLPGRDKATAVGVLERGHRHQVLVARRNRVDQKLGADLGDRGAIVPEYLRLDVSVAGYAIVYPAHDKVAIRQGRDGGADLRALRRVDQELAADLGAVGMVRLAPDGAVRAKT